MNEVADALAGACDREGSAAVVRLPGSGRSSSMRPLRPKLSVHGWHAPRAQAVVHARLQAAMVDTIHQGAGDVELGPMVDRYELICQAVASDRCQDPGRGQQADLGRRYEGSGGQGIQIGGVPQRMYAGEVAVAMRVHVGARATALQGRRGRAGTRGVGGGDEKCFAGSWGPNREHEQVLFRSRCSR